MTIQKTKRQKANIVLSNIQFIGGFILFGVLLAICYWIYTETKLSPMFLHFEMIVLQIVFSIIVGALIVFGIFFAINYFANKAFEKDLKDNIYEQ